MNCPRCRHENPPQARFCMACGGGLALRCSNCGTDLPGEARFCYSCGRAVDLAAPVISQRFHSPGAYTPEHLAEKILTSKAAIEGERKHVTVLFADLKGSMELLADRDPEEARKLLDPILELMMEAVHRYEGTVNQVMGDGIMALFGAPIAHEDHAVRASYAALRMQQAVKRYAETLRREEGVPIAIRAGLNSGEVVVRAIGSDLHTDYTAVGQSTHLAARMEQLAEPGTTVLTSATLGLAEGFIQVRSLGSMRVKGLNEAVEVYELIGANAVRSRFQAHAARGLTRFVGRVTEMTQLGEALGLVRAGRGQVVAVVGEAGVGKSRLFWEFAHSHRTEGCLILEAASVSYGKATTFFPVTELLRGYFQIEPRDDTRKIREKVIGKVLSLDRALEPAMPALLGLLDVPVEDAEWSGLDPGQRREYTLDAVKRLLLRESQIQPLIVLFEDLHWIDGETQAALDSLVDSLPNAGLLLLVNYRPEYQHEWSAKSYCRQLRIDVLSLDGAAELLGALLGKDPSLDMLKQFLMTRTEGNPFFIEETVRALIETKVLSGEVGDYRLTRAPTSIDIPATAQALLAARIDRLAVDEKRVLQAASVIGKDVPFALLEAVADMSTVELRRAIGRLQAAEFVYEARLFPEVEYTFKHALTHEVTYRGVLNDRRTVLHARIVAAIEALYRDRLVEHVERLAHHAVRGDVLEKAVTYLRQAGATASARGALTECVDRYEQALELLARMPTTPDNLRHGMAIRLELSLPLTLLGRMGRLIQLNQEAEPLARQLDDQPTLGRIMQRMSTYAWMNAQYTEGLRYGDQCLLIANGIDDAALRVSATYAIGLHLEALGKYREAVAAFARIVDGPDATIARQVPGLHVFAYAGAYGWLASSLALLGDFQSAESRVRHALESAAREPLAEAMLANLLATPAVFKGDFDHALTLCERAVAVCEAKNVIVWAPLAYSTRGWVLAWLGRCADGLADLERGVRLQEATGARTHLALFYVRWAEGLLLSRDVDRGREIAERARALAVETHEQGNEAWALRALAEADLYGSDGELGTTEELYRTGLALADELGMRPLMAHCHAGLAQLYRRLGKRPESDEHFAAAASMFDGMGMTYWLARADKELRRLP